MWQPIRVTKQGRPVAQLVPVTPPGKRQILGCMEGTRKILGDIVPPATPGSDWEVLES
ncbi:MAG TPA: hypothetical protein VK789_07895 [Bryobacteraceae bacterium]|nr:hypothetical protein [Bryobacteraceae bacterium]